MPPQITTRAANFLRFRLKGLWLRAGKPELHRHYTFDCGRSKMSKSKPILAHIHDLPGENLTRVAQQLDR